MATEVKITALNRKQYKGVKGTYAVFDQEDKPVLKSNGKPWSGKTLNMGNYYGVIIGSGKYNSVTLGAVWKDGYKIKFLPSEQQEEI